MPTYEYRCPQGHLFERFQRISDEPKADCPTCGAAGERLLSGGAGFLLKGDGFYATDYRSDSYKKEASRDADTPGESKTGGGLPKKEKESSESPSTTSKPKPPSTGS